MNQTKHFGKKATSRVSQKCKRERRSARGEVPVLLRKSKSAFSVILVVALLAGSAKVSVARGPTHYLLTLNFTPSSSSSGKYCSACVPTMSRSQMIPS